MKLALLFLFVFVLELNAWKYYKGRRGYRKLSDFSTARECDVCKIESGFFTQKLDHFEPSDTRTWKQQFFSNDEFYDASSGGPVFLYIEGEGPASEFSLHTGQWVDNAKKFHALCFSLEHRYYGASQPTEDTSTENLKYLSSEQALADLASFIVAKNEEYNLSSDVKWIVFGGSYAGNLAAWFRLKYPHLAYGAVASSAPVLAELDFQEYLEVVYESIKVHSENCATAIQQATSAINELLETPEGLQQLNQVFSLCPPLTDGSSNNQKNISYFFENIADGFAGIVQYNDESINVGTSMIDGECNILVNESIGEPIERLASLYEGSCIDTNYDTGLDDLKELTFSANRMWFYQTCTEFGYYQTSAKSQIFPDQFKIDFFTDQCVEVFGEDFNAEFIDGAVKHTNMIYGQLDIEVSNTVFVHGSIDPWHALGILATRNPEAPVVFINGTSHCQDMGSTLDNDLPQLIEARRFISENIEAWLNA